ncbi:MAG: hypothetical protein ACOX5C_08790 [Acutalibacteraceae bacterium]|jgi:hypothetical protein
MALAKYAEDNLEMYYERMAMSEHTFTQEQKPQQSAQRTTTAQNRQKEKDDAFRSMFAGESCFFW